jgi:hypothetical protein
MKNYNTEVQFIINVLSKVRIEEREATIKGWRRFMLEEAKCYLNEDYIDDVLKVLFELCEVTLKTFLIIEDFYDGWGFKEKLFDQYSQRTIIILGTLESKGVSILDLSKFSLILIGEAFTDYCFIKGGVVDLIKGFKDTDDYKTYIAVEELLKKYKEIEKRLHTIDDFIRCMEFEKNNFGDSYLKAKKALKGINRIVKHQVEELKE